MNQIIINRKEESSTTTIGELKIINKEGREIFTCYTLEPKGESTDIANKNQRIMPRVYGLYLTSSSVSLPKGFNQAISLFSKEVQDFKDRRIHFHIGNTKEDTKGCILLGFKKDLNSLSYSRKANEIFYEIVSRNIQDFRLEIREIV